MEEGVKSALEEFVEGGGFVFALLGEVGFFAVAEGVEAGGLFDDDEVFVEVADDDVGVGGERGAGVFEEVKDVAGADLSGFVKAEVAVEGDVAFGDEAFDLGPGDGFAEDFAQGGGEGLAVVGGSDVEDPGHGRGERV